MISKLEIKRQLFHMGAGLLMAALVSYDLINEYFLFLFLCFALFLSVMSRKYKIPIVWMALKNFDRDKDRKDFPGKGAIYSLVGYLLAIVLFPKDIALAAIMITALGDSIGPLIGHFGRYKHPFHNTRYFEGLIAGIFAGFFGAMFFVVWYRALIASTIAMIVESIDEVKGMPINDNIAVPIVAGIVLLLL